MHPFIPSSNEMKNFNPAFYHTIFQVLKSCIELFLDLLFLFINIVLRLTSFSQLELMEMFYLSF